MPNTTVAVSSTGNVNNATTNTAKEISTTQWLNNSFANLQWDIAKYTGICKGILTYYTSGPDQPSWKLKPQATISALRTMDSISTGATLDYYRDYGNKLAATKCKSTKNLKMAIPNQFRELAYNLVKSHLSPQLGDSIFDDMNHWSNSEPLEAEWVIPHGMHLNSNNSIFLYFHGGGFYEGAFSTYREPVGKIVTEAGILGLGLTYRLAPEFTFPCQLEDALATILYLTSSTSNNGFGSSLDKIVVGGDSSGGHLTSILFHFMRDNKLGKVAGGLLWSPLLDATHSQPSTRELAHSDFLEAFTYTSTKDRLTIDNNSCFKLTYQGSSNIVRARMDRDGHYLCKIEHINHPLMSPLCDTNFSNLPPMLIQTGHGELLRDEAYLYAKKVHESTSSDSGGNVKLQYFDEMPHAFMVIPGFTQDLTCLNEAIKFIKNSLNLEGSEISIKSNSEKLECYLVNTEGNIEPYNPDFKFEPIPTWTSN